MQSKVAASDQIITNLTAKNEKLVNLLRKKIRNCAN